MKTIKMLYWVSTSLLALLILLGVYNYIFNHDQMVLAYEGLGYPSYLIYPLAIAKVAAIVALMILKNKTLKEWAYAGLAYDFILGFGAHLAVNDGEQGGAVVALVLLMASYITYKKLNS